MAELKPIVALKAVAVAEVEGPAAALAPVDALDLERYDLLHAISGDLLRRLGRAGGAALAYEAALARTDNAAEGGSCSTACSSRRRLRRCGDRHQAGTR